MNFTNDEMNLMAIYNTGSRTGLVEELTSMREYEYLEDDEAELLEMTNAVLAKLEVMTDVEFAELDLIPDFDEEDANAE